MTDPHRPALVGQDWPWRPPLLVLEVHQYDEQGWLLGRWGIGVDPGVLWPTCSEGWAELSEMLLHNIRRGFAAGGYELDLGRLVWWVRPPGEQWPEQPVTLPLGS